VGIRVEEYRPPVVVQALELSDGTWDMRRREVLSLAGAAPMASCGTGTLAGQAAVTRQEMVGGGCVTGIVFNQREPD
jgi:hypothetical protein